MAFQFDLDPHVLYPVETPEVVEAVQREDPQFDRYGALFNSHRVVGLVVTPDQGFYPHSIEKGGPSFKPRTTDTLYIENSDGFVRLISDDTTKDARITDRYPVVGATPIPINESQDTSFLPHAVLLLKGESNPWVRGVFSNVQGFFSNSTFIELPLGSVEENAQIIPFDLDSRR